MRRFVSNRVVVSCWRVLETSTQQRGFASKRNKAPRRAGKQQPGRKKPRSHRQLPPGVFMPDNADSVDVPPAYLSSTGSSHVYIASCAAEDHDIDPQTLFTEQDLDDTENTFFADFVSPKQFKHELPKWNIPEVAFLGRSNVGKSSLVNALLKRDLARCSKQPGRTQQVNYFGVFDSPNYKSPAEADGFFVDLPGYGFAKAPPDQVKAWQARTQSFLLHRRDAGVLRRLFVLVDARRGTSQIDRDIMGWFDEATIPYSVVLTKADRVGRPQIVRFVNDVCMRHHSQLYGEGGGSQGPIVHVTSARNGDGIRELMMMVEAEFAAHREEASGSRGDVVGEPWKDYGEDDDSEG